MLQKQVAGGEVQVINQHQPHEGQEFFCHDLKLKLPGESLIDGQKHKLPALKNWFTESVKTTL